MSTTGAKSIMDDLNLTHDEAERLTKAFKNDEFKKLFYDYCEEIQNPENMKLYENEITQLESERGVKITFLYPEPGFVLKTSIDGKMKIFINIAKCSKIDKPNGNNGNCINLPYAQAPPRNDLDKRRNKCVVYDVLFHPDAHEMAGKNVNFRKYMIESACDGIEREFQVKIDRINLKLIKMKFKGMPRPIVTRKQEQQQQQPQSTVNSPPSAPDKDNDDKELNPIDSILPPIPKDIEPKVYTCSSSSTQKYDEYTLPNYHIIHRRNIDLSEMTYELDAKLNLTIPKELLIEIELPLLNSTNDCILDVTKKQLYFKSDKLSAKYKLNIELPYLVNDKNGTAKFDSTKKLLIVQLPVEWENTEKSYKDLIQMKDKEDSK